ncbi:hypothetical protein [Hymenobacter baengnokdamensis]|uniref:hypothetical protein n=1 Tax=Hymenobacter baengnokdamensis TaxID=2615203 RepID=UPI0012473F03|nr:hypothetical protein [Hymenobacter baengnokdamensis]
MEALLKPIYCLLLLALLTGCDENPVEVNFARPFPANEADAAGFLPRHQGRYVLAEDTAYAIFISNKQIIRHASMTVGIPAARLDSLGLPRREGLAIGHNGEHFQILALTSDSCHLRWTAHDTLVQLSGAKAVHLRRYRGWYYLSAPADSGRWEVERIGVVGRQLYWQMFNCDSLRIRALPPSILQLKRATARLIFTLNPGPGSATRQVNSYAGLWLMKGDYLRKEE